MSTRIAAVLIVRDEAARLPACLEALRLVVDELVIADTGSQDETPAIAAAYTDRVLHFEWPNSFAVARNRALEAATADYVLQVDADEVLLEPELARNRLDRFTTAHATDTAGLVRIVSPIATGDQVEILNLPRFFFRAGFRYQGPIHEQLQPLSGAMRTASTGLVFQHGGYALTGPDAEAKAARNLALLQQALMDDPGSFYLTYQLGKTFYCAGNHQESAAVLARAAAAIPTEEVGVDGGVSPRIITDCVTTLAYALVNQGEVRQAAQQLSRFKDTPVCNVYADFRYALAYVRLLLHEVEAARESLLAALERGPDWEIVKGTGSFAAHYQLGLCAEALGSLPEAAVHYAAALQAEPRHHATIDRLLDWPIEYGKGLPSACARAANHDALRARYQAKLAGLESRGRRAESEKLRSLVGGAGL